MIRKTIPAIVTLVVVCTGLAVPAWNAKARLPSQLFLQLDDATPPPRVTLTAAQAADGRWVLDINAERFVFTEICRAVDEAELIGHAHVYSGGRKIAGAYHPRVDLGHLPPGLHRFDVMLRTQDHRVLAGPDGAITEEILIFVSRA